MAAAKKRCVIIGPSDVEPEIAAIREVLDIAKELLGDDGLEVWYWRSEGGPGIHPLGAQGLADEQMNIAAADLMVGVLWSRLGSPVLGDESGTAHELRLAVESWREKRRPEIFLYFCERDIPATMLRKREQRDQYDKVIEFRDSLPKELSYWPFAHIDELRSQFNKHLGKWLNVSMLATAGGRDDAEDALLSLPDASRALSRRAPIAALQNTLSRAPIVCLVGLSGSGKTLLAAQYATSKGHLLLEHEGGVVWYDVPPNGSLDDMLAAFPATSGSPDLSAVSRAKILLSNLRRRRRLLIIDDVHRAEPRSFNPLVAMALRESVPSCILLLSRSAIDHVDVEHFTIPPWRSSEIRKLLSRFELPPMSEGLYEKLRLSTGGLPLAVKLFTTLVKLGNQPERLLAGELAQSERTNLWYAEIQEALSPSELALLRYFSLAEPYVTEPIRRRARARLPTGDGSRAFFRLQTLLLVEPRGKARWAVHPFVAEHAVNATPDAVLRILLQDLCRFSWEGIRTLKNVDINHAALVAGIRACQYAQRADDFDQAERIIDRIAGPAKRLGHYRKLKTICQTQIAGCTSVNPWVKYHLAHCELILGDASSAVSLLARLTPRGASSALAFTAARVLADARAESGQLHEAVTELRNSLTVEPPSDRGARPAFRQGQAALARLLIEAGSLDEALEIATALARSTTDERTRAILTVLLGLIDVKRRQPAQAAQHFQAAAKKFRSIGDRRGLSWALQGESEALLMAPSVRRNSYRSVLREALITSARIGEATDEYAHWLERIRVLVANDPLGVRLVDHERARIGGNIEIIVTLDSTGLSDRR